MALESMEEASDDEQMEDPVPGNDEAPHSGGNTRSAREDQLRRLWDDDGTTESTGRAWN